MKQASKQKNYPIFSRETPQCISLHDIYRVLPQLPNIRLRASFFLLQTRIGKFKQKYKQYTKYFSNEMCELSCLEDGFPRVGVSWVSRLTLFSHWVGLQFVVVVVVRDESFEDAHSDAGEDEESGGFGYGSFLGETLAVAVTILPDEFVERLAHLGFRLGF